MNYHFWGQIALQNLLLKVGANSACLIGHHADSASRISCCLWVGFLHRICCQRQEPIWDAESAVWKILGPESDAIPMGKFWHQNQKASQWANSGIRIGRHPNGQILAPESDGIPMGKFWDQNQMAFLAAKSDGIQMGKFWHQNQTPTQYFEVSSRGQAVEDFVRSLAHPKGLHVRNHPPELN